SSSVRKAHNNGKNHIMNVRNYYAAIGHIMSNGSFICSMVSLDRRTTTLNFKSSSSKKNNTELGQDKAQAIIDEITRAYERAGQSGFPSQYGYPGAIPPPAAAAVIPPGPPFAGPPPAILLGRPPATGAPGTSGAPGVMSAAPPGIAGAPPVLGGPPGLAAPSIGIRPPIAGIGTSGNNQIPPSFPGVPTSPTQPY
ncbi:8639_t:CDS:2, partial [Ambispora leptoticha]